MGEVITLAQLTAKIDDLDSELPARAFTGLGRLVQRELKANGPVPPERLERLRVEASASAADVQAVTSLAETDGRGRITGALGLTVTPTVHRFRVDGRELFTWCAFDGIVFPIAHGWTAEVRSVCPTTGQPITLTVTPQGITSRDPQGAVLAVAVHSNGGSSATTEQVKTAFCTHNNVYASTHAAQQATADDPDLVVVDLDDAHRFGQRLVAALDAKPAMAASESYACTLSPGEAPARVEQVGRLTQGLQGRQRAEREVRLRFDSALAPVVRAFVRDEARCCGFYDFAVHETETAVELVVRAPAEAELLLASLYDAFAAEETPPA